MHTCDVAVTLCTKISARRSLLTQLFVIQGHVLRYDVSNDITYVIMPCYDIKKKMSDYSRGGYIRK